MPRSRDDHDYDGMHQDMLGFWVRDEPERPDDHGNYNGEPAAPISTEEAARNFAVLSWVLFMLGIAIFSAEMGAWAMVGWWTHYGVQDYGFYQQHQGELVPIFMVVSGVVVLVVLALGFRMRAVVRLALAFLLPILGVAVPTVIVTTVGRMVMGR